VRRSRVGCVRRRLATVLSAALLAPVAVATAPAPPASAVDPLPAPTSVTLAAGATTLGSQDSSTLTATANWSVSGTGRYITIFDRYLHYAVASCGTGSTCSVTRTFNDLANVAHTYVAYVGDYTLTQEPPPNPTATSNTVTIAPVSWSATLSSTLTTLGSQDSTTITVTANHPRDGTVRYLSHWQSSNRLLECSTGSTCSLTVGFGDLADASRTYVAYVSSFPNSAPPAGTLATSNTVTLTPVAWSITLSSTATTVGSQESATLTATANQSVTNVGKAIWIYDAGSRQVGRCATGTTCSAVVPFGDLLNASRTYTAYVGSTSSSSAPPPGTVATSNSVTVSPVAWSLTLSTTHSSLTTSDTATLTATTNQSVSYTGKWVLIVDSTRGLQIAACNTGTTCTVTQSYDALNGAEHSYIAYLGSSTSSAPPPGLLATSNIVSLAPVPWSVTLTSSRSVVGSGETTTLTATANQNVYGRYLMIVDQNSGGIVKYCNTGTSCSLDRSFSDLGDVSHRYVAYVSTSSSSFSAPYVRATSNEVVVTTVPWSITLTHAGGWLVPGEAITLTATTNQSASGSGSVVQIHDVTANTRLAFCYAGATCQVSWSVPQYPVHRIVATVAYPSETFPPPKLVATSNLVEGPTAFDVEALQGASSGSASALDPVNVATGNFYESRSDLVFPAQARGLAFTRTYNSRDRRVTTLGRGWSAPYSATATMNSLGEVELRADDGRLLRFTPLGTGWASPAGFAATLVRLADGTFRLDDHHGNTTSFDGSGAVARLDFADGTYVDVTRAAGRTTAVTSSTGRSLSFAYSTAGLLTSVTANDGRAVTFAYTGSNLTTVTGPAGVTTYTYDSGNRVRTVVDGAGRVAVTNTYDAFDRVVSQQTAPGQTVTFAYSDTAARTTTVTEGAATTVYTHDADGRVTKIVDSLGKTATVSYGSTGFVSGSVDRAGTSAGVTTDSRGNVLSRALPTGTETYTYDTANRLLSATDVRGKTTTFAYTGAGRVPTTITHPDGTATTQEVAGGVVTSVTDADGVTTTYTYDVARNLVAVTDDAGRATTMSYDAAGRMTARTTPLGHTTSWTYDAAGRVLTTTDPNGEVSSWTYDGAGNVLTETDEEGHVTSYAYDASGQLVSETSAGATTTYAYNTRGELVSSTEPGGATTTYTYGALGRVATETGPMGEVTSYTYDADGRVVSVVEPGGGSVTTTYDTAGRVSATKDALDRTMTYGHDAAGHVTSTTDPTGAVTSRTYDDRGRLLTETDPLSRTTTHAYTPGGRLASVTYPGGAVTSYGYDAAGRHVTTTDAGLTTTTAYDSDGRVVSTTSPAGLVTSYTYDDAGQTLTTATPGRGTTVSTYTGTGLVATRTDATGGVVSFGYDAAGRLTSATDANGGVTGFTYDGRGNRVSMTDARSNVWTWTYDLSDRLTAATDPLSHATTYTYDAMARPLTATDASGRTRTTTYDLAGQVTRTAFTGGAFVDYTYDAAGRVLTASDGTATETTAYDAAGNLLSDSYGGRSVAYTYDARDRVATITYPSGAVATNAYDTAGRLTGVTRTGGGAATYTYDSDGRVLTETLPGGVTRSYQYTAGLLSSYAETRGGVPSSTSLSRDAAGRITSAGGTTYAYDPAGQLTSVDAPGTATDESYVYDATGNPTTVTTGGVAATRTYDAAARLTTSVAGGVTTMYTHDDAGRVTASSDGVAHAYDGAGRLLTSSHGGTTWTRTYSPRGRLARVTVDAGSTPTVTDLTWDATRGIPQVLSLTTGAATTDVYYGSGKAFATTGVASPEAFSRDALGNLLTTPGTASVVRGAAYAPFGTPDTAGALPAFGYRGELHVGDQVDLRARAQDPALGRFLTRDPLDGHPGQPVVANPYHYAANDPINSADPTGLDPAITDASLSLGGGAALVATAQTCDDITIANPGPHSLGGSASDAVLTCKIVGAVVTTTVVVGTVVSATTRDEDPPIVKATTPVQKRRIKGGPGRRTETGAAAAAMRFQVQWTAVRRKGSKETFALPATAPAEIGVTASQAVATLKAVIALVEPTSVTKSSSFREAEESAIRYIKQVPPSGITGRTSHSTSFKIPGARSGRIDVENIAGWNLRYR